METKQSALNTQITHTASIPAGTSLVVLFGVLPIVLTACQRLSNGMLHRHVQVTLIVQYILIFTGACVVLL